MKSSSGPLLQIDVLRRAARKQNMIDHMSYCSIGTQMQLQDGESGF